jgi:hypothetical protein
VPPSRRPSRQRRSPSLSAAAVRSVEDPELGEMGECGGFRGGEWAVSGVWGVLEESSGRSYYFLEREGKKQGGPILYRPKFVVSV